jgi:hypothetical protein
MFQNSTSRTGQIRQNGHLKKESKGNSYTYVHTRVTSEHLNKPRKPRRRASEWFQTCLDTKERLVDLANEINDHKLKGKLEECHNKFAFLTCGTHTINRIPNATCEFRLCPFCSQRRARKIKAEYLPKVEAFQQTKRVQPVLITLTLKHREEKLSEALNRLNEAFKKLSKRKLWKDHFKGGLRVFDNTVAENGMYHAHFHILAFRSKFIDHKKLKAEWKAVTGDSFVVNIKRIDDIQKGLKEVVKYITKPLDIKTGKFTSDNLKDFLELRGKRLISTFGEFYKFCGQFRIEDFGHLTLTTSSTDAEERLVEGDKCPHCDHELFQLRQTANEFLSFQKLIESYRVRANSPPS